MKTKLLFVLSLFIMVSTAHAQNSEIETAMQETKAEKFLDEVSFFKEIIVSHTWEKDLDLYGKIYIDLKNPSNKIAAVEFRTNNPFAANFYSSLEGFQSGDPESKALGYLDLEEVESLLKAMRLVSTESKAKTKDEFRISYIAPGGISLFYKYDEDYEYQLFFFRKAFSWTNKYGTNSTSYVTCGELKVKDSLDKILKYLEMTKLKLEEEIVKDYNIGANQ